MQNEQLKQLQAKGWQQMSATLDKEMPVSRKRRWLPFMWLVGVGLSLVAIGWWMTTHTDVSVKPTVPKEKQKVTTPQIALDNASDNSSTHTQPPFFTNTPNDENIPKSTKKRPQNETNHIFYASSEQTVPFSQKHTKKTDGSKANVFTPTPMIVQNNHIPNTSKQEVAPKNIARLVFHDEKLPLLGMKMLKSEILDFNHAPSKITIPRKRSALWGHIAGGYNFDKQWNTSVGLRWAYQIRPKWSLETALRYYHFAQEENLFSKNKEEDSAVAGVENIEEDVTMFPEDINSPANPPQTSLPYEQSRAALGLSAQLVYHITPRWQGGIGVQPTYCWYADRLFSAHTEWWTTAEIRFLPRPRWAVALGYRHSFGSWNETFVNQQMDNTGNFFPSTANQTERYNRFAELSVHYRF